MRVIEALGGPHTHMQLIAYHVSSRARPLIIPPAFPPRPSHPLGTLEEKRASLTALGAQLAGRGAALSQTEAQLAEQQRNLDRLTGELRAAGLEQTKHEEEVEAQTAAAAELKQQLAAAQAAAAGAAAAEARAAAAEGGLKAAEARVEDAAAEIDRLTQELAEAKQVRWSVVC